jgi:hypothetical protein
LKNQSSPGSKLRMTGWPGNCACTVACCAGELSQQPMCPHWAHRRRCSHQPPVASHSTQPVPLGGIETSIPGVAFTVASPRIGVPVDHPQLYAYSYAPKEWWRSGGPSRDHCWWPRRHRRQRAESGSSLARSRSAGQDTALQIRDLEAAGCERIYRAQGIRAPEPAAPSCTRCLIASAEETRSSCGSWTGSAAAHLKSTR